MMAVVLFLLVAVGAIYMAIRGGQIGKGMDALSLYRVASSLVVASIISGILSIGAIYLSLPAIKGDFTHHDALIDVLAVLVTVLMGWNIISVVDFKKKAESMELISDDFQTVISGIMQLNINNFMLIGDKDELFDNCVKTLDHIRNCKNDEIKEMAENEVMELLHRLCVAMNEKGEKCLYKDHKEYYKYTVSHVESKYQNEILNLINDALDSEKKEHGLPLFDKSAFNNDINLMIDNGVLIMDKGE